MNALLLAAVLPALSARAALPARAPEAGPARPVRLPPRVSWKLANGMDVVFVEDRRAPLVTAILATSGGEASFPAEDAGVGEALAELLTEGTATKSARDVADAAENFGGSISASSDPDAMLVEATALADKAGAMMALLAEVCRAPSFPEKEVALRRANMKEELAASRAESPFLAAVAFHKKVFWGHPYAVTAPTDASIARLTRDRVVAAHRLLFTPREALLVVAGDMTAASAKALVDKSFGSWAGGESPPDVPPVPARVVARTVYLFDRPKSSQTSFLLGNLAAREDNQDYLSLLAANGVLGGSFSSRLVNDVRESKGYAYDVGSSMSHRLTASLFEISTAVRTPVSGAALKEILDQVEKLRQDGPTDAELKQAKAYLAGRFARRFETQSGVAHAVLHQRLQRLPDDFYDRYVERLQAVTPASAQRAARTFMRPEEMVVAAVGDASLIRAELSKLSIRAFTMVDADGN